VEQSEMHTPETVGGPCKRCGLSYSLKTAYVDCFADGDTFQSWAARQSQETLAMSSHPGSRAARESASSASKTGT
jgi:hypothetical protein